MSNLADYLEGEVKRRKGPEWLNLAISLRHDQWIDIVAALRSQPAVPEVVPTAVDSIRRQAEEGFELQVPILEFLRSVPIGYQCHWEGHRFIPLKRYCEAAATVIEKLEAQSRNSYCMNKEGS